VIDDAHLMNAEAQNAILKTLEEPPGDALIILVARNSQRLLETIRSRCQIIQFGLAGAKELEIMAKDLVSNGAIKSGENILKEAVDLSFGRPGRLVKFIADPSLIEKRQADAKEFARIVKSDLAEKFIYAAKVAESENLVEIIEVWQYYFHNLLLEALRGKKDETVTSAGEQKIQFAFSKVKANLLTPKKISDILKKIHALSVTLQTTNASPKLAIENLMLDL